MTVPEPAVSQVVDVPSVQEPSAEELAAAASRGGLDDDLEGSLSARFFRGDEESVPPAVDEHVEPEAPARQVLSQAIVERRARMRRVVAGVVSFVGVISLAVIGKSVAAPHRHVSAAPVATVAAREAAPDPKSVLVSAAAEAKQVEPAAPQAKNEADAKVEEAPKPEATAAEAAKVEEAKDAVEEKKAEKADAEEPKKAEPSADAKTLRREAESLLNRGKLKDAIEKAKEAIEADPDEAISYLYLGSALQDSGKWKDGLEAYSECVRNATKGPIGECRAMGGHK